MSTVAVHSPHDFGRHPLFEGMARPPHHNYREGYAPQYGHYAQEQHPYPSHPLQVTQQPRLPPMATMISTAGPSHHLPMLNGRDPHHLGGKPSYYLDYATPSPVGQTPPQFPGPSHDLHSLPRRAVDIRRSPTLSSTASDRSSDEVGQEMRLRQMGSFRDHHGQSQISRHYGHQSPHLRGDSSHHEHNLPPVSAAVPAAASYSAPALPSIHPAPPHLPQSPRSTQPSASPKQDSRSMSISNILSSDASNQPLPPMASPQVASSIHRISVRQQPYAARSCGFGERDRRVIDPPPIVQLTIHADSLSKSEVSQLLRHQFSVVHCSIWDEKGEKDMSSMPEDFRQQRRLMGTLVASPFVGLDENGEEGCFFCFPDLSCRTPGSFRLKFALVVLDPVNMRTGSKSDILATVFSDPFQVYNAKDFPGMKASTQLTKRLKEQGCLISIKKGNEKRETPGSSRGGTGKDDDDYDDDDSDEGAKRPKKKKARRSA